MNAFAAYFLVLYIKNYTNLPFKKKKELYHLDLLFPEKFLPFQMAQGLINELYFYTISFLLLYILSDFLLVII